MMGFDLVLRFPTGGVLVGGYSDQPSAVHARSASDKLGPLIPATALRGAIRETLEALLRGAGEPACSGGDGVDPSRGPGNLVPCTLDGGRRCKACRLFGSRRPVLDQGERRFSGVILGTARVEAGAAAWGKRPGVAIERRRRSARDRHLFMQQVPAVPGLAFTARGRLLDPELRTYFVAAAGATTHVGAGRSRGLARVNIELRWHEPAEVKAAVLPAEGDVRVRVTLRAPASIGVPVVQANLRETRSEIPGTALRGAVGFALAEVLLDPDNDAPFNALVAEDGASFGFLYPVDGPSSDGLPEPLPITAAACKREDRAHGVVDTLFDRLAASLVTDTPQVEEVERSALTHCHCKQPLRTLEGWRQRSRDVPIRTVTRAAMDRSRGSARDEQLFSQELVEEGTTFEGMIRQVPAQSREHLARALALPLSLGRGRASMWGRVDVEILPPRSLPGLEKRAHLFGEAFRLHLKQVKLPGKLLDRLVPITLLSPLITQGEDDGADLLLKELGVEGARCLLRVRSFSREGGWDQRSGGMWATLATAAGGVFVLDLGEGRSWSGVLQRLSELEQRGIGARRCQGYGRVVAFDPFFRNRNTTR